MPPPPPKTVASTLRHLALPLSILAVGLVCTLGFYVWGRHVQALDDQARIREYSERVEAALRDHLGRDEDLLLGAQGYLAQRGGVTPAAWADYIRRLDLARRHPGLSSMAFIVPVPDADLASFRAHGLPPGSHYHLPQADPQPLGNPGAEGFHLIITRCEPAAQSPNAIGLDVGASRTQREAADRARATARAALSGLLYFSKDQGQQEAVALFLPSSGPGGQDGTFWAGSPRASSSAPWCGTSSGTRTRGSPSSCWTIPPPWSHLGCTPAPAGPPMPSRWPSTTSASRAAPGRSATRSCRPSGTPRPFPRRAGSSRPAWWGPSPWPPGRRASPAPGPGPWTWPVG